MCSDALSLITLVWYYLLQHCCDIWVALRLWNCDRKKPSRRRKSLTQPTQERHSTLKRVTQRWWTDSCSWRMSWVSIRLLQSLHSKTVTRLQVCRCEGQCDSLARLTLEKPNCDFFFQYNYACHSKRLSHQNSNELIYIAILNWNHSSTNWFRLKIDSPNSCVRFHKEQLESKNNSTTWSITSSSSDSQYIKSFPFSRV